ncbi:MAG: hypothetical protein Fur0032_12550 [Terrimicrobiaceae bacterium]
MGEEVYGQTCATCHYDGSGSATAPDLKGGAFWKNPPEKLFGIILRGQSNVSVVDGKPFYGIMPAMPYLSDEEIAAVTAYVFKTFGAREVRVEAGAVAVVRKAGKEAAE